VTIVHSIHNIRRWYDTTNCNTIGVGAHSGDDYCSLSCGRDASSYMYYIKENAVLVLCTGDPRTTLRGFLIPKSLGYIEMITPRDDTGEDGLAVVAETNTPTPSDSAYVLQYKNIYIYIYIYIRIRYPAVMSNTEYIGMVVIFGFVQIQLRVLQYLF